LGGLGGFVLDVVLAERQRAMRAGVLDA